MAGPRCIAHVDMDAFFASVEVRDNPVLRGKPVLVGYPGKRGVVAAASYEARRFGCHSAQPMVVALRKCPTAVVIAPRHERYVEVSRAAFEIFGRFTPLVEGLSIDEAFLDLTGTERLHGPPRVAAQAVRAAIRDELSLTCSVGLAANKFVAKIASERNKPDGLTEVPAGTEQAFLAPLPVRALWGVGPRTEQRLRVHGATTIGDIAKLGATTLEHELGEHGLHLHRLSLGLDDREVEPGHERKQISHENTFHDDLLTREQIEDWLLHQATRVADRLHAKQLRGRKVHIKLRDTGFHTWTRQATLERPSAETKLIFEAACMLLDKFERDGLLRDRRFRLTGLGVSELSELSHAPEQLSLLEPAATQVQGSSQVQGSQAQANQVQANRGEAVQDVLAEVRRKFGGRALFPAGKHSK